MELEALERLAYAGEQMPDGLDAARQGYFQGVSYLYARHRMGAITKEDAAREKAQLRRAYDEAEFYQSMWQQYADRMVELAGPAADFRKNPSVESAKRVIDILFGIH